MHLSGSGNIQKNVLLLVHFVNFVVGGVFLGFGIWLNIDKREFITFNYLGFIVIGTYLVFLSICACYETLIRRKEVVEMFLLIIVAIFVEVVVAIAAYNTDMKKILAFHFLKQLKEQYGQPDYKYETKLIDHFQEKFDCCGYETFHNWKESLYVNITKQIPKSCCKDEYKENATYCGLAVNWTNSIGIIPYNVKGCYNELLDFLEDNMCLIRGVALSVVLIQIILFMLGMMFMCRNQGNTSTEEEMQVDHISIRSTVHRYSILILKVISMLFNNTPLNSSTMLTSTASTATAARVGTAAMATTIV